MQPFSIEKDRFKIRVRVTGLLRIFRFSGGLTHPWSKAETGSQKDGHCVWIFREILILAN